jgi:hypothetical protein
MNPIILLQMQSLLFKQKSYGKTIKEKTEKCMAEK